MAKSAGTAQLLEESPIFSKTRVDFTPTYLLAQLVVDNNNIVLAMASRNLIRIDREHGPERQDEIDLTKTISGAKISALFSDPTISTHLLISLKSNYIDQPELYNLHKTWAKPTLCSRFRGSSLKPN